jgi:hypothetical protein
VDRVRLSFSEAIDPNSFTLADVVSLEGPSGAIVPLAVHAVGTSEFEVAFAPQNTPGVYRLVVGPDITDVARNAMDQDQDGVGGENPGDRFDASFGLERGPEYVARFDFGTAVSPVAQGYIGHPANHRYSAADGYGWQLGSVYGIDRRIGDELTRDFNYTKDATFAVDLANGEYDVIVTLGDTAAAHDQMGVYLEDSQVDTVNTAAGQTLARTYRVDIGDGQLNLRLDDLGGSDIWVMMVALDVVAVGGGTQSLASVESRLVAPSLQPIAQDRVDDRWSRFAPKVIQSRSLDYKRMLDLIISQRTASTRLPTGHSQIEARDTAVSELYDVWDDHELNRHRIVSNLRLYSSAARSSAT